MKCKDIVYPALCLKFCAFILIIQLFIACCNDAGFVGEKMHVSTADPIRPSAEFGGAVAVNNDYAIIGASGENDHRGAAYLFKRNNDQWEQQQRITSSDGSNDHDFFGISVALDNDYAIVGSWWDDKFGYDDGAAYIFRRNGDRWEEEMVLLPDYNDSNFGISVSIHGDYAVVGATDHKIFSNTVGAAYLFHRNGNSWEKEEIFVPSYPIERSGFGSSVSIFRNYIIVGAEGYEEHGRVFIYEKNGNGWGLINTFDGESHSHFGRSVSIDGIFAIVGAPFEDNDNGTMSGSVYIYKRVNTQFGPQWERDTVLTGSDGTDYDFFGVSVSMNAKSESGGFAIAGAEHDDNEQGVNAGAAYILWTVNGKWMHCRKLIPAAESDHNLFGSAVSLCDNYAVIGAPYNNSRSGCVYFYK
jgi:hypothetical protein